MKLSVDFGRWTTTKAALAVAGLLAIIGAVGSALAVSPTVSVPIKWAGGVAEIQTAVGDGNSATLYTVPAGRNFMLTDLMVSNLSSTVARYDLSVCSPASFRLRNVIVPPNSTVVVPFVTGFGFTAGQSLCIGALDGILQANARGFLFTAAPAS